MISIERVCVVLTYELSQCQRAGWTTEKAAAEVTALEWIQSPLAHSAECRSGLTHCQALERERVITCTAI